MDKKPEECKGGAPEWMVTYGDLVTLLMCFFVLLFAFSEIDAQKFQAVMQSFQGSAGVLESGKSLSEDQLIFDANPEADTTPDTSEVDQLEVVKELMNQIKEELEETFEGLDIADVITVEFDENKIIIRLKNSILFDPAKAEIKPEALEVLAILGETLMDESFLQANFRIDGHTDDVPINTLRYPSNWELSAARAASVLRYFKDELGIDKTRFSIAGYADNRPLEGNDTPEGRAANRRVEIIIEDLNLGTFDTTNEGTNTEGE